MHSLFAILLILALVFAASARTPCTDDVQCDEVSVCWYDYQCYTIEEVLDNKAPPVY